MTATRRSNQLNLTLAAQAPSTDDRPATALARSAATRRHAKATRADRQLALRFIVHIVDDLHQPLHTGPPRDREHVVEVEVFGERSNLHSIGASGLIDRRQRSFTEYAAYLSRRIEPADVIAGWNSDPNMWIAESTRPRETSYPEPNARLTWACAYQQTPACR